MLFQRSDNGWVVHSPAKINLGLEVFGRLADGYHQVETLLVPVRLWDTIVYSPTSDSFGLHVVTPPGSEWSELTGDPKQNLVTKAVNLLAQEFGREPTGEIFLHKRIPTQAGLGGGSSDAAATLALLNRAWNLGLKRDRLLELACQLGTDVPFFLQGGAALGTGRGEQLQPVSWPGALPMVLVKPPQGLSTPAVFAKLGLEVGQQVRNTTGYCQRIVDHLRQGNPITTWGHFVRNSLQAAAVQLSDAVQEIAEIFRGLPLLTHQMTGSGTGYFGICHTYAEARHIASRLRGRNRYWAIATSTCL